MAKRLADLAAHVAAELVGNPELLIEGVNTLQDAGPSDISFLANKSYRKELKSTQAGAVILHRDDLTEYDQAALVVDNPYLAYARIAAFLFPEYKPGPGIDPSAVIAEGAIIHESVSVGPGCVIEEGSSVGKGVVIGPNSVVGRHCSIGEDSRLIASVTLCQNVTIGRRCTIHPGAVIGSEGFGMANDQGKWVKIPQLGGVRIGDDVDVGANTTIDRGAIRDTVIDDGVKLDNLIMVAHNVEIGEGSAIAACSGISGSTRIGKHCTLAGQTGLVGHIELADNVHVSGKTMVSRSLREPGQYSSGIPALTHAEWRKNFPRLKKLDEMVRRLNRLEKEVLELTMDNEGDQR